MRKLVLCIVCLAAMMAAGTSLKAQEISITLVPGWNWISYTNVVSMEIDEALGDFTPVQGDIIKSKNNGTTTYNGTMWRGGLTHFMPGQGYKYFSARTETTSLIFAQAISSTVTTTELTGITPYSATSGGSITTNAYVFAKGICWATHSNPTPMDDDHSENGGGNESFTVEITDLIPNTTYYVRAYVVTQNGIVYGNEVSFTTIPIWTIEAMSNPIDGGTITGTGDYEQNSICNLTAISNEGFVFTNWTENGEVVSTEASYTFTVNANRTLVANFEQSYPIGAINGIFSVSATRQVYFSQGNLQYIGSASRPYWKFADNQWDCLGTTTGQNSSNTNVDRDLFGWGTSGYNHGAVCYQPWSTSTNESHYYAYGHDYYDLYEQTGKADWGYNPIDNGGNQTNQWRTLMDTEWNYVFNTRTTTSGIRYAKAEVNGINGVILLPNDWDASYYPLNDVNQCGVEFASNMITAVQWGVLEQNGAVFLPAAGFRRGIQTLNVGSVGYYWSSAYDDDEEAYSLNFHNTTLNPMDSDFRDSGLSIRLVRNTMVNYTIETSSNPLEGGTVTGASSYPYGSTITLVANANEGYVFTNWTENGEVVSTNANYTFTVNANRTLVANFSVDIPTGAIGGLFTINYNGDQVYFSCGNLQYQASTNTWRFAENQYNYVGNSNSNASPTYSGWIDLFGWGTSGYNHGAVCFQPWSTSEANSDYYAYGQYNYNLYDQSGMADWGYNAISNGGNQTNQWRTLTKDEWDFIINYRQTPSGVRWVQARVNNVNGMILLPDDWSNSYYSFSFPNINSTDWGYNPISSDTWNMLEQHGAVFLPASGSRWEGGEIGYVLNMYWSSAYSNDNHAYVLSFGKSTMGYYWRNRFLGCAVRLVQDVE